MCLWISGLYRPAAIWLKSFICWLQTCSLLWSSVLCSGMSPKRSAKINLGDTKPTDEEL